MMFDKRKQESQPYYRNDFNAELAALVAKAIAAHIHLIDIRNTLNDRMMAVDFLYAQRPVI
jgi:hypothetical protein